MPDNSEKYCMLQDLGCKPTREVINEIIANDIGIYVLGNTVFCDAQGCSLAFSVVDTSRVVYGDCREVVSKYKTQPSSRTIAL